MARPPLCLCLCLCLYRLYSPLAMVMVMPLGEQTQSQPASGPRLRAPPEPEPETLQVCLPSPRPLCYVGRIYHFTELSAALPLCNAGLMPADAFLALHGGPAAQASVLVQVPVSEDSGNPAGWNLNGQTLTLGVTLASTAKQIKEQLSSQHLGGLPANKLQLKFAPVGFLKDAQSLAEANVPPGALLELSLKSRGGKR